MPGRPNTSPAIGNLPEQHGVKVELLNQILAVMVVMVLLVMVRKQHEVEVGRVPQTKPTYSCSSSIAGDLAVGQRRKAACRSTMRTANTIYHGERYH